MSSQNRIFIYFLPKEVLFWMIQILATPTCQASPPAQPPAGSARQRLKLQK
jgi:hypothetical protein